MSLIGIDIGNTTCKIAYRDGESINLVSKRMPDNMVRYGEMISPDTMSKFLSEVRKNEKVHGRECALVLDSSQAFFRHATLPPMSESELELNLPYEFRDFILGDPSGYVYDYAIDEIMFDENGNPIRMELFAAAAEKDTIAEYAAILRKAGFKLKMAIPAPMAYSRLLAEHDREAPEQGERDVVLVDIGHADVVVSLFMGSHYDSSRVIDFGCDEFDRVIADIKGIDPYVAGAYKFSNFEGVLDEEPCLALCDRFALEVAKVVNFYNFNNPDKEIEQIYFLGGGANIPQLTDAIAEAVSVPAEHVNALLPAGVSTDPEAQTCALAIAGILEGEAA